jgi:hypothetical protein
MNPVLSPHRHRQEELDPRRQPAYAGPKIAAILSIVESCRRLNLPVRDYLGAILPGLADLPIQRLRELTPAALATQKVLSAIAC